MLRFLLAFLPALALLGNDLPSAASILDRFVKVTGGRAAYERRHSDYSVSDIVVVNTPAKGTITAYHEAPAKAFVEMDLPLLGKFLQGSDGKAAWEQSPITLTLRSGADLEIALISGRYNGELHWRELFDRVETVGTEEVDGKPAYVVEKTPRLAKPIVEYYDVASGLLVKAVVRRDTEDGEAETVALVSDYRDVGGVMVPFKTVMRVPGQEHLITVREFVVNRAAPPGTFDLPKKLQEKAK